MNDDYLWDGSGEPDPDVQRLEQVLGHYRYQPKPLSPALSSRFSWQRRGWVRVAAAAAVIVLVLAGLWIIKVNQKLVVSPEANQRASDTGEQNTSRPETGPSINSTPKDVGVVKAVGRNHHRKSYYSTAPKDVLLAESPTIADSSLATERQPILIPFIDLETARHLEHAQLMLRSFRNAREYDSQSDSDLAYEKQQSRGLLYKNIVLRRDAEARGNLPAENVLSTLEPFLLDIANLPDKPTVDEVRSIKERMQKKEIVSALQIYSAPILSQSL